jgi:hypothetical protein
MVGVRASGDAVDIDVLVQPRASRARIGPVHGDRIKVAVTAPPVDGEANAALSTVRPRPALLARRRRGGGRPLAAQDGSCDPAARSGGVQ